MSFSIKRTRLNVSFALLIIIAATLAVFHSVNGPRLVKTTYEGPLAAKELDMYFNVDVKASENFSISTIPETDFRYEFLQNRLRVIFESPLSSSTKYTIAVANIADNRGHNTRAQTSFTTEAQQVVYLSRDEQGTVDIIRRKTIGDSETTELYRGNKIGDFAVANRKILLVIEDTETQQFNTALYQIKGTTKTAVEPPKGIAIGVSGATDKDHFLVRTRDQSTLQNHLFLFSAETSTFTELIKENGDPIHASHASFAADSSTIVYTDAADGALYLLDSATDRSPLSFGVVSTLQRYLPDDSGIFYESTPGKYEFVKNDGVVSTIVNNIEVSDAKIFTNHTDVVLLKNDFSLLSSSQKIIMKTPQAETVFQEINNAKQLVRRIDISPNDEYILIQQSNVPVIYDGYRTRTEPKQSQIELRSTSGLLKDSFQGSLLQWL